MIEDRHQSYLAKRREIVKQRAISTASPLRSAISWRFRAERFAV